MKKENILKFRNKKQIFVKGYYQNNILALTQKTLFPYPEVPINNPWPKEKNMFLIR